MLDPLARSLYSHYIPAPWHDPIKRVAPRSIRDTFYWCEHVVLSNQLLNAALQRLVSYFITDIEVLDVEMDEAERIKQYLYDRLSIDTVLFSIGMDYLTYGNVFISVHFPIEKDVLCPKCKFGTSFEPYASDPQHEFQLGEGFEIILKCERCKYKGPWEVTEKLVTREDAISIIRWNVHDIDIIYEPLSGTTDFVWTIPGELKSQIEKGSVIHINRAPNDIIMAIKENIGKIKLDRDNVLHLKEDNLCGVRLNGWGLSPIISCFSQSWLVESLRRALQAVALDYVVPIRILSPQARQAPGVFGDAALSLGLDVVEEKLRQIIHDWRRNPYGWYTSPFPILYTPLGGEANRILPSQIIEQANLDLINGLNIPMEFFRGTLSAQGAPLALRILEGIWGRLLKAYNRFLSFLAGKLSTHFRWDAFRLRMAKPTHIDDLSRQMARLQLAMSGGISMTTGLKALGLDYMEELRRQLAEQKMQALEYQKLQDEMAESSLKYQLAQPVQQQGGDMMSMLMGMMGGGGGDMAAMMGGGGGGGAAPMGAPQSPMTIIDQFVAQIAGKGGEPVSLDSLRQAAHQLAQQLMAMHPSERKSAMLRLKQKHDVLHALTKQAMEEIYQQTELQARVQAQQQAQQQTAGQVNLPI